MVKFLLRHPISVLMAFLACFIIGVVTYMTLPVSLLPDIAIPKITVQVEAGNVSARELEDTRMSPLRRSLLQLSSLEEMSSDTRDGIGVIHLSFKFGTNTDLAFIEVNEKIDNLMNDFPKDAVRPKAVKASATDIPVFYLHMALKSDSPFREPHEQEFLAMCELADNVVRRRIEQLPQVAMADVTGIPGRMIRVTPDMDKMQSLGMTVADIEGALTSNNVEPGSMLVRDGYLEYNIRISSMLRTQEDIGNIYLQRNGHLMQLKDLCDIEETTLQESGRSMSNGKRAVTLAIIKQSKGNMDDMKDELQKTLDHFASTYPDIDFSISRNQTELLDYTISNLEQNFVLGFIMILIVVVLFIGDFRSPFIIGMAMVTSVVVTFFIFYIFGVSLNIISLSGMILAVGMMIDNAIIVTENIEQYRARGYSLMEAAAQGTTEMITPMLSSSLTTIAVFIPLVFMSGIAGAIFMDQAFSITAGLLTSYITGITLLPVLYTIAYSLGMDKDKMPVKHPWINDKYLVGWYNRVIDFTFAHSKKCTVAAVLTLPLCALMFLVLDIDSMPEIDHNELVMKADWNENIHISENVSRVNALLQAVDADVEEHSAYIGTQDYVLSSEQSLGTSETELYFRTETYDEVETLKSKLAAWMHSNYPHSAVSFEPPKSVFETLFDTGEADVTAELQYKDTQRALTAEDIEQVETEVERLTGVSPKKTVFQQQIDLNIDRDKLLLYQVDYDEVVRTLRTAFRDNQVTTLHSFQQYLPINIGGNERTVSQVLQQTLVRNNPKTQGVTEAYIPLQSLVSASKAEGLKTIVAGKDGEYVPLQFYGVDDAPDLMEGVKEAVDESGLWNVSFSGGYFKSLRMMDELIVILLISVMLMYFILCAQFESFLQPLLVLSEIPMDTAFALVCLWACGQTLNLMSAIGIIVSCGIVVNDSILKLDSINRMRKEGMPLLEAIHTAGHRRLRAIVMTTLTTVFAMLPMLFTNDMGSQLQRPLAIAMISAMMIGTFISMFVVPLFYWMIYRRDNV